MPEQEPHAPALGISRCSSEADLMLIVERLLERGVRPGELAVVFSPTLEIRGTTAAGFQPGWIVFLAETR